MCVRVCVCVRVRARCSFLRYFHSCHFRVDLKSRPEHMLRSLLDEVCLVKGFIFGIAEFINLKGVLAVLFKIHITSL